MRNNHEDCEFDPRSVHYKTGIGRAHLLVAFTGIRAVVGEGTTNHTNNTNVNARRMQAEKLHCLSDIAEGKFCMNRVFLPFVCFV